MDTTPLGKKPSQESQVAAVFAAAPGNQRVLLAAMEACREPRTPDELDELMGALLSKNRSVFGPVELRALLEKYGALVYQKSNEEVAADQARERGEETDLATDADGNLVVATPAPGRWVLTEEGRAFVDSDPQGSYALELLEREGYYAPVYLRLLEFVAEEPRGKPQIDHVIDADPLLQEPRMFAGHFVGELEKAGALEWDDAWAITEVGEALLRDLRASA